MPIYIDSREKLREFLNYELRDLGGAIHFPIIVSENQLKYKILKNLRQYEYHLNVRHKLRARIRGLIYGYWMNYSGVRIPANVADIGLSIGHVGNIVVNRNCVIGKNCRIHIDVNIGAGKENQPGKCPVIGDDVYIGPGAKIFGNITIASGCKIGANAVVNRTFPNSNKTIVGVPAEEK